MTNNVLGGVIIEIRIKICTYRSDLKNIDDRLLDERLKHQGKVDSDWIQITL